ncbi:hypothetical protein [Castellaniella defragrans]|jgi:hypothetical protein|uniref:Uncharacterized protein n=2 Tax=Castellaniella defragrans TaxID=75697 RepID=W8WZP6_CASD6|nr:hypothetical protein [Castellaniella defragrans]KAB0606074.1 hypothetical protein F7Q88_14580 [Castellaniella defragrans]MBB6085290.1 hypothetical protein [Castellaniella defragrans]CDM25238.1 hypothetical protein BN940_13966 [Castellaniella defragrans 65Phen]
MYPSIQVGKYLVSPLVRRDHGGRYIASVSIRSGRASMTHDRLMRFTPLFESAQAAAEFAKAEAFSYIRACAQPARPAWLRPQAAGASHASGPSFATN